MIAIIARCNRLEKYAGSQEGSQELREGAGRGPAGSAWCGRGCLVRQPISLRFPSGLSMDVLQLPGVIHSDGAGKPIKALSVTCLPRTRCG